MQLVCQLLLCFDLIDPSVFEFMRHSPIVDSSQFTTKLLFYSAPGDTFAYQSQSNIIFNSFYKVNEDLWSFMYQCAVPYL